MHVPKIALPLSGAAALACLLVAPARAQIGVGWTAFTPTMTLQEVGDVSHSVSGGVETFSINDNSNDTEQRVEQRVEDDFTSGLYQFQGYVKVTSLGGTGINLKQVFGGSVGPWMLLAIASDSGGRLYDIHSGTTLATGVLGATVQINTVTDANNGVGYEYVNGSEAYRLTGGPGQYYDKYGTYRSASGHGPVTAQWWGIQFWSGGTAFQGTYQIINQTSGMALNNGGSTTDGSPVSQWNVESSPNLEWTFLPTGSGYFQIASIQSGLDVAVQGASTTQNAPLVQEPLGSTGDDQWKPVQNSNGTLTFFNLHSGMTINNPGGSTTEGTQYTQWAWRSSANEEFTLTQISP